MKNVLLGVAVLATAACHKTENTTAPVPATNYRPSLQVTGSYAYTGKTVQGDSAYNFLGYGYDVSGKYADSSSVKHQVINAAAFLHDFPSRFNYSYLHESGAGPIIASNAYEMAYKTYYNMMYDYKLGPFKNAVTGYFPEGDALSAKYVYASYEAYAHYQRLEFTGGNELLKPYLTTAFLEDVQHLEPADLVNKYGTHILTGVIIGSKLKAIYQAECTSGNRRAAAIAGITVALDSVFKIGTGYIIAPGDSDLSTVSNSKLTFDIAGGDLSKIKVDATHAVPRVYLQDWIATTATKPFFFVDLPYGALLDITDMIDDAAKKEAVSNYIKSHLKSQVVTVNP